MSKVIIYTDGSCLGNPGAGGYAALLKYNEHEKEISQGYLLTTNNRMELLAPIKALSALQRRCDVELYTDSQYVKNGINSWIYNWKKNGWKTSNNKPVKNSDLWKKLDKCCEKHNVKWHWVKAHNGQVENERVDDLARTAAKGKHLIEDQGFEPV